MMAKIYSSITELIGRTPLVELKNIEKEYSLSSRLVAKIEYFNPAGSVKDRVAAKMIEKVEKDGSLVPGSTIIEPTSGNTGIGLAAVAAAKGYKTVIVMPDSMSAERILTMKAYGAEVILTDGKLGMSGCIAKAEELKKQIAGSIVAGQFVNPANPEAHYETTGPEIYEDTDGDIDFFVCGVGTGGTITGTGRYLKEKNENIRVVAVEPAASAVLSGRKAGRHGLQGIGAGFVPEILDKTVYDEIITVSDEEAYEAGRLIAQKEGFLVGISAGAALKAAINVASRKENAGKTVVVLLPDTGSRYLSTPMFA